ncbi:MAG: peptidoglycan-binding protein [Pseudomonadota bacterium]
MATRGPAAHRPAALMAFAVAVMTLTPGGPLVPAPLLAEEPDGRAADRAAIAEVQASLAALGYDPGPADGLPGPRTAAAIEAWQRDRGHAVTGKPDAATIAALRAERAAGTLPATPPAAVVAGTRPGAAAAPAPTPTPTPTLEPAPAPIPSVSSPARRGAGTSGTISARRGLEIDTSAPGGLTPHGRRADSTPATANAPGRTAGAGRGSEQTTVRADEPLPRVRNPAEGRQLAEQRPAGVGTLPGQGRIGDRPPPPGQTGADYDRRRGAFDGSGTESAPALIGLPFLPAIIPPDWLTKTRLAAGLGTLALLSLLCHRIARRRPERPARTRDA